MVKVEGEDRPKERRKWEGGLGKQRTEGGGNIFKEGHKGSQTLKH